MKRPHRRRARTVQSDSPCAANVHPHLTRASFGQPESIPQKASRSVQPVFAQFHGRYTILYNGPPLSPQNCPFAWGIWSPIYSTWFLGSTRVHNPNGICLAVLQSLRQPGLQTMHATPSGVCNNRRHLRIVLR